MLNNELNNLNNDNLNNNDFIDLSPDNETQDQPNFSGLPIYTLKDFFEMNKTKVIKLYVSSYKRKKDYTFNRYIIYLFASLEKTQPAFIIKTYSQNIDNFISKYILKNKINKPFSFKVQVTNNRGKVSFRVLLKK